MTLRAEYERGDSDRWYAEGPYITVSLPTRPHPVRYVVMLEVQYRRDFSQYVLFEEGRHALSYRVKSESFAKVFIVPRPELGFVVKCFPLDMRCKL